MKNSLIVRIEMLTDLPLPEYETEGAAGMDLRANIPAGETVYLMPGDRVLVPVGFKVGFDPGWQMEIRPRSGLAFQYGVTIANSPGTVDSDYRGEVKAMLENRGGNLFKIERGDRVAQAVFTPVGHALLQVVPKVDETARGEGSFGSTGIK